MDSKVEESYKELGSSIPVESVQEIASKNLKEVPLKYIRPELESDEYMVDESMQVPVIDMRKLVEGQLGREGEMNNLHLACKEWGFFQVINHGVEGEVIEKMKKDIQAFFKLPLQEKMEFAPLPNELQGYGKHFVVTEEQKLDWVTCSFLLPTRSRLETLNFGQPLPPPLDRETVEKYSIELQRVEFSLLNLMSKNLGLEQEKLESRFRHGTLSLRMNYYPPCMEATKVIGLTPHSDLSGLTLLMQVNEVLDLQIKKHGKWLPVKPIPGAFVINIGDIIEIMSNGEYKSMEHRAVVNAEKERLSVAAFHSPNLEAMVGPMEDLIKERKANYTTIFFADLLKLSFTRKLDGKSLLELMKVEEP